MNFFSSNYSSENQKISLPFLTDYGIELFIKREDQIHPLVSGNKFRKLKYTILKAKELGQGTLLTFRGAYSNHIAATAAAGAMTGMNTIGVISGEELGVSLENTLQRNQTLRKAQENGMQFHFVTRSAYRDKNNPAFLRKLANRFGNFYTIPEGGTNALAIHGCKEILKEGDADFDILCCPVGTGGTIAGIIEASYAHQKVYGYAALKGAFLNDELSSLTTRRNWLLYEENYFGGYAKVNEELILFINHFYTTTGILLDPIYTGKMIFRITDHIKAGKIPKNTRILAIHTGGIQGISGMNEILRKKKLPLIRL